MLALVRVSTESVDNSVQNFAHTYCLPGLEVQWLILAQFDHF